MVIHLGDSDTASQTPLGKISPLQSRADGLGRGKILTVVRNDKDVRVDGMKITLDFSAVVGDIHVALNQQICHFAWGLEPHSIDSNHMFIISRLSSRNWYLRRLEHEAPSPLLVASQPHPHHPNL